MEAFMTHMRCLFFFFQAEDGIRDLIVTGVQTCALPISLRLSSPAWLAQPSSTSSIAAGSSEGLRASSAAIGTAARSSGRTAESAPPERPNGGGAAAAVEGPPMDSGWYGAARPVCPRDSTRRPL